MYNTSTVCTFLLLQVAYDGKPKDMDETFKGIVNKHVIPLEGHKDYGNHKI